MNGLDKLDKVSRPKMMLVWIALIAALVWAGTKNLDDPYPREQHPMSTINDK